jgi:tetratricopeptide (TPR) repeat protein
MNMSEFIERYISNEMTGSELKWFLKEIDGNDVLKREIELRKQTDVILKRPETINLRNKLINLEKERKAGRRFHVLKYAATLIIAALITGAYLFNNNYHLSNDELLDKFFKSYEAPTAQRSSDIESNDYTLGLQYYNSRDYKNAAIQFAKVLEKNPNDMQTQLLTGVSNMEEKLYPEAKNSFKAVIDHNNSLFIEPATWYLALCYLKTDETNKATKLFTKIKNEGGYYSADAKKIMRKIQ